MFIAQVNSYLEKIGIGAKPCCFVLTLVVFLFMGCANRATPGEGFHSQVTPGVSIKNADKDDEMPPVKNKQLNKQLLKSDKNYNIVHQESANVGVIYVVDEGHLRYLRFDGPKADSQSVMSLQNPSAVPMEYVRLAMVSLGYLSKIESVLMIGLGAGSFTNVLFDAMPKVAIDVVEISPQVERVARDYFSLPSDDRYKVTIDDGYHFVQTDTKQYDLLFVDAYFGEDLPPRLVTKRFFKMAGERMTAEGICVLNIAVPDELEPPIVRTFKDSFNDIACFRGPVDRNLILIGLKQKAPSKEAVLEQLKVVNREHDFSFNIEEQVTRMISCEEIYRTLK